MIHGFYLFNRKGKCLYSVELVVNKGIHSSSEHSRFLFGLLHTLGGISNLVSHKPENHIVQMISAHSCRLHSYQSQTGLRFAILSSPDTPRLDQSLQYLYTLYAECVLKNPLYIIGDVIKCERFEKEVRKHLTTDVYNSRAKYSYKTQQ